MRYAVIMAGGSGTRLWPMSRAGHPKQLIPFIAGRTLLEAAAERLKGLIDPQRLLICTGEAYRAPIRAAMPAITDEQILGEPEGRDTLAAVGLPAAVLNARDPKATIAVFTADHLIQPPRVFQDRVTTGFEVVDKEPRTLVTFGINPTSPATGYGYVKLGDPLPGFDGANATAQFKEKPDAATAAQYLASGDYRWNSGMFVWRAATLLGCIERYQPEVHAGLMEIGAAWGTPRRGAVLAAVYPKLKKISVDYAIMERAVADPAVRVATVSMPVTWLDVGSWTAYGQTLRPDAAGNRAAGAKALLLDSGDNIVVSDDPNHLIAAIGVKDLVIVHTGRATLICHRDQVERIKQLHADIGKQFGESYL
jgi:mannose-1-phosphate guanylyltransferase